LLPRAEARLMPMLPVLLQHRASSRSWASDKLSLRMLTSCLALACCLLELPAELTADCSISVVQTT
jgi:hypothetical protein